MPRKILLTGADLVLPDRTLAKENLLIEDGHIGAIGSDTGGGNGTREICLSGRIVLPGLIDMHSDAIERLVEGRPKVYFPLEHAIRESDRLHLGVGITTVFHAVGFAGEEFGVRNPALADQILRGLAGEPSILRRRLHLRFEVSNCESVPLIEQLIADDLVDLISFMDHSPGQGQYAGDGAYARYLMRTYCMTQAEAEELIRKKFENLENHAVNAVNRLVELARQADIPIAGHDLESPDSIRAWSKRGAVISEFPLNFESAQTSRKENLSIVMGSPNVVCGASSYSGMRAMDVIRDGLGDILCSDYNPSCLLPALFKVERELGLPLHECVSFATWKVADSVGIPDAGRIAPGCRADLIVVEAKPWGPQLDAVMVNGQWRHLCREL